MSLVRLECLRDVCFFSRSAQLRLIDSAFVKRFSFEEVRRDPWLLHDVSKFLHPTLEVPIAAIQSPSTKPAVAPDAFLGHIKPMVEGVLRGSLGAIPTDYSVTKRKFSNSMRLVFIAGLEGSGHHGLGAFLHECALCEFVPALSQLVYGGGTNPRGIFVFPGDRIAKPIQDRRADFVAQLRSLAQDDAGRPRLVVINAFAETTGTGEMSYPNYVGQTRIAQHVNVHELAVLAETAGVDLRIVVLARSAEAMLRSTTQHRHFERRSDQSAIEGVMAAVLAAQLQLVDPRFYLCVEYGNIGSPRWWSDPYDAATRTSRADWLHPQFDLSRAVASVYAGADRAAADSGDFLDVVDFVNRRDVYEAHLAAMTDYLRRTAACSCGAL